LTRLAVVDPDYAPKALASDELDTLRHVLARVIPQLPGEGEVEINLAAALDQQLSDAKGDGWRYASLPSDLEAYRAGLLLLDEFAFAQSKVAFTMLAPEEQESLLQGITSGELQSGRLDLKRWFEDLRASATQIYIAHPQTLARMGYSGIADDPDGFVQIGIGEREDWEPEAR